VLLAYDGSSKAQEGLFVATYLAGRWGIPLVVVTVEDNGIRAPEILKDAKDYLQSHKILATYVEEK